MLSAIFHGILAAAFIGATGLIAVYVIQTAVAWFINRKSN